MESSIAVFLLRLPACGLQPIKGFTTLNFAGRGLGNQCSFERTETGNKTYFKHLGQIATKRAPPKGDILAEGAMTLPVTLSGGVLFAS